MIQITVHRCSQDQSIRNFSVKGHAEFDESGKDIVCAGVSSVTVGTVNAIEALTGVVLANQARKGLLQAAVPKGVSPDQAEKVSLLLEAMLVMLKSIEQSYGQYVAIQEIYDK